MLNHILPRAPASANCSSVHAHKPPTHPHPPSSHPPFAESALKAGLAQFPESPYLHIMYSSFLIHQRGAVQVRGARHVHGAVPQLTCDA